MVLILYFSFYILMNKWQLATQHLEGYCSINSIIMVFAYCLPAAFGGKHTIIFKNWGK